MKNVSPVRYWHMYDVSVDIYFSLCYINSVNKVEQSKTTEGGILWV